MLDCAVLARMNFQLVLALFDSYLLMTFICVKLMIDLKFDLVK